MSSFPNFSKMKKIFFLLFFLPSYTFCQLSSQDIAKETAKKYLNGLSQSGNLKSSFINGFGVESEVQLKDLQAGTPILYKDIDLKKMIGYIKKENQSTQLEEFLGKRKIYRVPLIYNSKIVSYMDIAVNETTKVGEVIKIVNINLPGCKDDLGVYTEVIIDGKTYIVDVDAPGAGMKFCEALKLRINKIQDSNDYISYDENKFEKIDGKLIIEYIAQKLLKKYSLKELETLSDGSSVN
jgi:hypothetical protein